MSRSPLEQASRWLATGFGAGFLWPAPGTWGSLLGVVLFIPLLAPIGWTWQLAAGITLTILVFIVLILIGCVKTVVAEVTDLVVVGIALHWI